MFAVFLTPEALPFSVALAVVLALFVLELVGALFGGTILGLGGEGAEFDVDADFDLSDGIVGEFDLDADAYADAAAADDGAGGVFTWIGARDVPFLIWLVSFLTLFGLTGLVIQSIVASIFGSPLPALAAVALAVPPALAVTRVISNWVALIMPKTETSAMRVRFLGGHRGTITQGTAARGKPAEVKIKDRHGNIHYLRVEPLQDDAVFPQGSDVTLIRKRGDKFFVI